MIGWGILGTGKIARIFARALAGSGTGRPLAVASRSLERAERFGRELDVERPYGSYEALLKDDGVEVVYVATPHPAHLEWARRSAEAGKHILCEKPLAVNRGEAAHLVEVVRQRGVFLMEAFAYRCHPQTHRMLELLRSGAIGEVRLIEAVFGYDAGPSPTNYLLVHELAGGSILDVGCYTTSMARLIAGAAIGLDFAEPTDVQGTGHIGESTRVDHYAVASVAFPRGVVASLACGVQVDLGGGLRILGSEGTITLPSPWLPGLGGAASHLILERRGGDAQEIVIDPGADLYAIEADTVAAFVEAGQTDPPAITWEDSLGNMEALDRWRAAIGLAYDFETKHHAVTVGRQILDGASVVERPDQGR